MSDFPGTNKGARIANAEIYRQSLLGKLTETTFELKEISRLMRVIIRWLIIIALILFSCFLFGLYGLN